MSANKSPQKGATIGLITVVITQIILKLIGINNKSIGIFVTLLLTIGVVVAVIMIRAGNKGFGLRLNKAAAIVTLLSCILSGAMSIMIECYPQFGDTHKILAMILVFSGIGSFLLLIIFWMVVVCIFYGK